MAVTPGPGGFSFLCTSFGFEVRSGRDPIDLSLTDAIDLDALVGDDGTTVPVPDLTPLQESLDTLVFGQLPKQHENSGDSSDFARLFELGQLACELVLAEQDELVGRIQKAERQAARSKKRIAAYRDRSET